MCFAQCRLEANYAHQQELDMIPLMMEKGYKPQGWRKSPLRSIVLQFYITVIMPLILDIGWLC